MMTEQQKTEEMTEQQEQLCPPLTYGDITETATAFGAQAMEIKDLDRQLAIAKGKAGKLEEVLKGMMEEGCIKSLKLDMGLTVYLHRQIWGGVAEGQDKSALIEQLKAANETNFLITEGYNANKLAAWVRELNRDEEGMPIIPDVLKGLLVSTEKVSVRARNS